MPAERNLQDYIGKKLEELGWEVVEWGKGVRGERASLQEILLKDRLFKAVDRINGTSLSEDERKDFLSHLLFLPNTVEGIKNFLDYAKNGIPIKLRKQKEEREKLIYLFDFENIENNEVFAVKECEVEENDRRKRFDLCLFVNVVPVVGIETKNPFSEECKGP